MLTPFEGFVKDLSGTLSAMPMSSFLSSDMTTGPYLLAAPTKKSNKLTPLLRHYLGCKMSPARKTETFPALCVLVQKTHPLFMKQWQPMLLQHMREYPCPIPGYAFWHDNGTKPLPDKAKTNVIGSSVVPAMMFAGSACGEQATILLDSGATQCFIERPLSKPTASNKALLTQKSLLLMGLLRSQQRKLEFTWKFKGTKCLSHA
jgi:hypothetical protein